MSTSPLQILDPSERHQFIRPIKRINEVHDVSHFLTSRAYAELVTFLFQLNVAVFPRRLRSRIQTFETGSTDNELSNTVKRLRELLSKIEAIIDEAPPDEGPRRFGNVSFRKWYGIVEERASELLDEYLPGSVLSRQSNSIKDEKEENSEQRQDVSAKDEIMAYFIGSFGSAQRLDYGTGHELSFLAFLASIWKLGGFRHNGVDAGEEERGIVLGVIDPYLNLIRRLIKTYTLEPAGSHGVWGLDDHSFLPYIFGSAQYCPAITSVQDALPSEGSIPDAPNPQSIATPSTVNSQKQRNMYFAAVAFITDVKTGPFWEHSPVLFDISGVRAGWAKINKGMLKMYNAEVLSKFPVVQHFPFGSLLQWEGFNQKSNGNSTVSGITGTTNSGASAANTTTTGIDPPSKLEERRGKEGTATTSMTMAPPVLPHLTRPLALVDQIGTGHESSLPSLNPLTSPLPSSSESLPAAALPSARPGHIEHAGTFHPAPPPASHSQTHAPAQIHSSRPSHR